MTLKLVADRYLQGCVLYQWPIVNLIESYRMSDISMFLFTPLKPIVNTHACIVIPARSATAAIWDLFNLKDDVMTAVHLIRPIAT